MFLKVGVTKYRAWRQNLSDTLEPVREHRQGLSIKTARTPTDEICLGNKNAYILYRGCAGIPQKCTHSIPRMRRNTIKMHTFYTADAKGWKRKPFFAAQGGGTYRNWPNGRRVATSTWRLSTYLRIVLHGRIWVLSNRDKGRASEWSRQPDPGRSQIRPERRRRGKHQA